jgi:hypothetical protein
MRPLLVRSVLLELLELLELLAVLAVLALLPLLEPAVRATIPVLVTRTAAATPTSGMREGVRTVVLLPRGHGRGFAAAAWE